LSQLVSTGKLDQTVLTAKSKGKSPGFVSRHLPGKQTENDRSDSFVLRKAPPNAARNVELFRGQPGAPFLGINFCIIKLCASSTKKPKNNFETII
jgi:hypothetical protein